MRSYIFISSTIANLAVSAALPGKFDKNYGGDYPLSAILPLTSTEFSTNFDAEFQFANQTFNFLVDTGSSDTWVMQTGFQCFNGSTNLEIPQTACYFANTTYNLSPTFHPIPNENFGVFYGAGIGSGLVGYEDVLIGGIEVKNQTVGIVKKSTNQGDGRNSGLVGLAYPALTSAHPGQSVPNNTFEFNRIIYDPLLFTMANRRLIEPFFSLALQRTPRGMITGPGGYIGLGNIPPVHHSQQWATIPVETWNVIPANATSGKLAYWACTIDNVLHGISRTTDLTSSKPFQVIIDSGNPTIALPNDLPASINALFVPPAIAPAVISDPWFVDCNATAPEFAVTISGQSFWHNGQDLIIEMEGGLCQSAIISSDVDGVFYTSLGAAFLKNVVAVFDFGGDEMRFAANYE